MNLPSPLYAVVVEQELRHAQTGSMFWQTILKTTEGRFKAMMWDAPANAALLDTFPHVGNVIEITGLKDQRETRGSIVIMGFNKITKNDVPEYAKTIFESEKASSKDLEEAWNFITDDKWWCDKKHYVFIMACLHRLDKMKLFTLPAATKYHHNYQGGLLVHTAEVLSLGIDIMKNLAGKYSFMSPDVILGSIILHDMGKFFTYRINDAGEPEQAVIEKTIGHFFYAMNLIKETADEMDVDPHYVNEVMHCVASHHGKMELGSSRNALSIEAVIVNRADDLSSICGQIENTLKQTKMAADFKMREDYFYVTDGIKKYVEKLK